MTVLILILVSIFSKSFCNLNETEETFEETLSKNSDIIFSILYLIIFISSCIISLIIIFNKRKNTNNILETSVDVQIAEPRNLTNNQIIADADDNDDFDIFLGLSYIGRILFTIQSFEVIFFLYNLFIQAILLIPGLLYDMTYIGWRNFFVILYFIFSIFSSSILIIPSF